MQPRGGGDGGVIQPPQAEEVEIAAQTARYRDHVIICGAGEPSILMRPELYVTAAALAAALYVGLALAGVPSFAAAAIAALAGFALRAAAIHWRLALPAYRGRR